ncbi:hypothetical protein Tco_0653629 [Tanacetum coccineum]|uniref:Tf2-1-like SH3-like domain-containing protein n=1 Tax=Tanacetum coccineum TaxID=301880 RepID=A0ABQ4X135_9ASTR
MDRLSKRKFANVCHEKVVRIPLEGDEILRVHGERTQEVVKTLKNAKVDELKLSDISVVRDFIDMFPEDLSMTTTRVSYDLVIFSEENPCRLLRRGAWSSFEVSVRITEEGEILATSSETSKVENAPAEMLRDLDQQMEKRADDVRGMLLTSLSEALSKRTVLAKIDLAFLVQQTGRKGDESSGIYGSYLGSLVGSEMDEAHASSKEWNSGDDQLRLRWMIYLVVLANVAESVRDTIGLGSTISISADGQSESMIQDLGDLMRACVIDFGCSYHSSILCALFEALYGMKCSSPVLWAKIRESSLIGLQLIQETTDKFEVGDRVMLKVMHWKGNSLLGKRAKLALRYVGPFEILERIGRVAYRLRLPKELSGVHDTFHVSNLKKCLADASLHVPLDEISESDRLIVVDRDMFVMFERERLNASLCCDDIHDVTPRVSALAGCDNLSEVVSSADLLQMQVDLDCVHAEDGLHLHGVRVVQDMHDK